MTLLDLLVGDDDERGRAVILPANVSEGTQGIKSSQQAGFHVAGAGANQLVAIRSDRTQCGRSPRVDGVSMPKEQNPCATVSLPTSDQIITPAFLGTPLDCEAESVQSLHEPVLDSIDPRLVVGAGVDG